tara:strand:+ start:431 stop:595 length:165 start_codon:yes stop_codon:yes gene_type:complete
MNLNGVRVGSISKPLFAEFLPTGLAIAIVITITIAEVIVESGYSGSLAVMGLFH